MHQPNVFFVVLDAVRPDHLSCYGYPSETSPNIDEIAEKGVLFENAFSASPWSPDSHASMFTGLYPSNHGVLGENLYLSRETPNIFEIFNSKGYRTLGICPNLFVSPHFGFHYGFDKFVDESLPFELLKKRFWDWIIFGFETDFRALIYRWTYHAIIFQEIKKWITLSRKKNKPFFIFINYFDAHLPHYPRQPFRERFRKVCKENVDFKKLEKCFNKRFGFPYIAKEVEMKKEEWDVVKSKYDAEIAYIDFFLGKVFDYLKKYEVANDTFILITSDHGENLGDHKLAGHAFCLYDTLLHVPLIISFPRYTSRRKKISNLVSTVDIFPTLLGILNIEKENNFDGKNLIPFEERPYHKYILAQYGPPIPQIKTMKRLCSNFNSTIYNKSWKCIRSANFKYIVTSDGKKEWYDLKNDPNESKNIINQIPEEERKKLELIMARELVSPAEKKVVVTPDEEIQKRLRELGYF